jgi:hypothetical protein
MRPSIAMRLAVVLALPLACAACGAAEELEPTVEMAAPHALQGGDEGDPIVDIRVRGTDGRLHIVRGRRAQLLALVPDRADGQAGEVVPEGGLRAVGGSGRRVYWGDNAEVMFLAAEQREPTSIEYPNLSVDDRRSLSAPVAALWLSGKPVGVVGSDGIERLEIGPRPLAALLVALAQTRFDDPFFFDVPSIAAHDLGVDIVQ